MLHGFQRGNLCECPDVPPPQPWRVADVSYIQVRIEQPHERQMRIQFGDCVTLAITRADQIPLTARLIEVLRDGKEAARYSFTLMPIFFDFVVDNRMLLNRRYSRQQVLNSRSAGISPCPP